MNKQEYNGWTNYETWNVHLWITSDPDNLEPYKDALDAGAMPLVLADMLREDAENNIPDMPGVYSDLLTAALSEVNWTEIAQALIDEVKE